MEYGSILMLAIGLVICLFGYRIKKVTFFLIWFFLGVFLTYYLLPFINTLYPTIASESLYQTLLPLIGGLLLSLLGFSLEKICVSGICFFATLLFTIHHFGIESPSIFIGALIGIILGVLAVRLMKPATIIATAIIGAYIMVFTLFSLFTKIPQSFFLPVIISVATIGTLIQFLTTKRLS